MQTAMVIFIVYTMWPKNNKNEHMKYYLSPMNFKN